METIFVELAVILILMVANGVFAMAEIAVVSARRPRLEQAARMDSERARAALQLKDNPGSFLATVQIGITLIGILAGAFGGATLAEEIAGWMSVFSLDAAYAEMIGIVVVVTGITFVSLVIGELAPKRLALNNPERIAELIATPMQALTRVAAPIVAFLDASTSLVLKLLGVKKSKPAPVTEDEIRILIEQGTRLGVFQPAEEQMVDRVFRLADRSVNALLVPRTEIVWLDVGDTQDDLVKKINASGYSHFPVADGDPDNLLGIVGVKELAIQCLMAQTFDLQAVMQPALVIPEGKSAFDVLQRFKETGLHQAMVIDEYGGILGMVTIYDLFEDIFGELPERGRTYDPEIVQRADGSWLLDGLLPIGEFKGLFKLRELPDEEERLYYTLGGFVMTCLGRVPTTGDLIEVENLVIEVVDMDGHRVDKVIVRKIEPKD